MKRIHNTDSDSIEISHEVSYLDSIRQFKPDGLWYGIDDAWLEWCYSEMPEWIKKYIFELDVDMTNVLILSDINQTGMEVLNYQALRWQHFDIGLFDCLMWFYGWDADGGCVWDITTLKGFKKKLTPEKWFKHATNQTQ